MAINCEITLVRAATSEQLHALGVALWRWNTNASEAGGLYRFLDNQTLADLMAGIIPLSSQSQWRENRRGFRFYLRDEASRNRQTTINTLRRELPTQAIADILVEGVSWQTGNPVASA